MHETRSDSAESSQTVEPGHVVAGKYRLDAKIGEGGMGVVWRATQIDLHRQVAVKLVRDELALSKEATARTLQEARAAAQLRGNHVVHIFDVGCLASGTPYIAMEYLDGRNLADELAIQAEPFSVVQVVDTILQTCEALAEAHARNIVHRDLKLDNLFLAEQPDGTSCVKVLDFGVSKVLHTDLALTNPSSVLGSPQYMSPEQMRGVADIDARVDIWALGTALYELLTGVPPFQSESLPTLCTLVLEASPRSIRAVRPDVPEQLEAAVMRCLEKDRQRRFSDVSELAAALAPFASDWGSSSADRVARMLEGSHLSRSEKSLVTTASDWSSHSSISRLSSLHPTTRTIPPATALARTVPPRGMYRGRHLDPQLRVNAQPEPQPQRKTHAGVATWLGIAAALLITGTVLFIYPSTSKAPAAPSSPPSAVVAAPNADTVAAREPSVPIISVSALPTISSREHTRPPSSTASAAMRDGSRATLHALPALAPTPMPSATRAVPAPAAMSASGSPKLPLSATPAVGDSWDPATFGGRR